MDDMRRTVLAAISANKEKTTAGDDGIMHVLPGLIRAPERRLLELFEEKAVASAATVEHIGDLNELPAATRRYLLNSRPAGIRRLYLNHPSLASLDWQPVSSLPELELSADSAFFDADVSITRAFCGIAETGSIVLLSESGVSSAAYFLPGVLIVALSKDRIVAAQEDVWTTLQAAYSRLPRTVTLVTGPSRTGDIEQKLVIGAHGPKEVHMVLYDR